MDNARIASPTGLTVRSSVATVPVVHYTIDDELHRRAKIAAAQLGITLKEFLERALEEKVKAVERKSARRRSQ